MALDPRLFAVRPDLADQRLHGEVDADHFVQGKTAQIIWPSAPLYRLPQSGLSPETTLLWGETVRVFDQKDDFAWVQADQDDYVGYLATAALGAVSPATHWVMVPHTHFYNSPDLKTPPRHDLGFGSKVRVIDENPVKGFLPVAGEGWIYQRHLVRMATRFSDPVAIARRLIGVPYLWGGRDSAKGIDCSALVQLSLAACGLALPRDSDQQRDGHWGRGDWTRCPALEIESTDHNLALQAGDLVFFPGHVGIMQDKTHLLHANASHMAVSADPLARLLSPSQAPENIKILSVRRPIVTSGHFDHRSIRNI